MQTNDLNRMILAIEEDARLRIKEIKIQSVAKYNMIKAQAIDLGTRKLDEEYMNQIKEIDKKIEIEKYIILNEQRKRILEEKNKKIEDLLEIVKNKLIAEPLNTDLLQECTKWIDVEKASEYYAVCKSSDQKTVLSQIKIEFLSLPEDALGGIIICSKKGDFFCDNSFATRLDLFRKKKLNWLNKRLFK